MKNIVKLLFAGIFGFLFVYLIGCFIEVSFNISEWDVETRGIIGFFGASSFIVFMAGTAQFLEQNKD